MQDSAEGVPGGIVSVGLTGNIGSGKSTVANMLAGLGAGVIDADDLARQASSDPHVLERIAAEVDPGLVRDGALDRPRTAQLVFDDDAARRRLEGIIHPWVRARSRRLQREFFEASQPPPVIVHDIPLLFENGLAGAFDAVIVVTAPEQIRAERLAQRSDMTLEDFLARDAAQTPLAEKVARADFVVDNSGDEASLREQVEALWRRLTGGNTGP